MKRKGCNGEITYTERKNKLLIAACDCGEKLGWHSLDGYTVEVAKAEMSEWIHAHRIGVTFSEYCGIREDGEPMTEAEYEPFAELIRRTRE